MVSQNNADNIPVDSEDNYNRGAECFNERDQVRITDKLGNWQNSNYLDKLSWPPRLFSDVAL